MYTGLLHLHSTLRYVVLLGLIVLIVRSFLGWTGKKPFTSLDNKISLYTLIATHTQFLAGLVLYFVSPFVQFNATTMSDTTTRYWTVEHITMMAIAIILITVARASQKKLKTDPERHRRLFVLNGYALVLIIIAIVTSGRGLFGPV